MKCKTCNTEKECHAILYLKDSGYFILGQYGSEYDMQLYAMKRAKYNNGGICDDCIKKYIETGYAQLIEDGVW